MKLFDRMIDKICLFFYKRVESRLVSSLGDELDYGRVAENIDSADVAYHMEEGEIANHISAEEVVEYIDLDEIASRISVEDVAAEIDHREIASNIPVEYIAECFDEDILVKKCISDRSVFQYLVNHPEELIEFAKKFKQVQEGLKS